ncbi:MAG: twin-arginine translocase TatA/TatE family subunit [Myxococcaceae bacterium]
MFNLGAGEIALISVVALLLLGPDKLPELARGLGKAFREFRKHTEDVRTMVEREFYRMDQDVLQDASKKAPGAAPEVSSVPASRFGLPLSDPDAPGQRILPAPGFPAFPAPDGVVASRPPAAETPAATPAPSSSADTPAQSDPHADVVPGRDA